ncbi:MAG: outer membrane lipoprotein-sorting protein [Candidatus Desantisbacteria bacterium]
MRKRILIMTILIGGLFIKEALSLDLQQLIEEAKARQRRFEKTTKDLAILQEATTFFSAKEIISEIRLFKKGKRWRLESVVVKPMEKKTVLINDGKNIWMVTSLGKRKLSEKESKGIQIEVNWWEIITGEAKIMGTERLEGKECYMVGMKEKGNLIMMWIDKDDLVLIKTETRQGEDKSLVEYSDFRKVGSSWKMPYRTTISQNNEVISTVTTKSIEINKGLPNKLFDPNKEKDPKMLDLLKEVFE